MQQHAMLSMPCKLMQLDLPVITSSDTISSDHWRANRHLLLGSLHISSHLLQRLALLLTWHVGAAVTIWRTVGKLLQLGSI